VNVEKAAMTETLRVVMVVPLLANLSQGSSVPQEERAFLYTAGMAIVRAMSNAMISITRMATVVHQRVPLNPDG
jgi:hypothetical protein